MAFEPFTTLAALATASTCAGSAWRSHRPQFRHPRSSRRRRRCSSNVTGGRSSWVSAPLARREHDAFGIPLPRCRAIRSARGRPRTISALFGRTPPPLRRTRLDATVEDYIYPLRGATNEPAADAPVWPIHLAGSPATAWDPAGSGICRGWPMPGNRPGDVAYFAESVTRSVVHSRPRGAIPTLQLRRAARCGDDG